MAKKEPSMLKLSKKAQRKLNAQQRNMWPVSPATRVVPSGKAYSRKGRRKEDEE